MEMPPGVKKYRRARRGQDLWVLEMLEYKCDGFFIELGAYDGEIASDTYMLEKGFGWDGVCIEPSNAYNNLVKIRSCKCMRELVGEDGVEYPFVSHNRKSSVSVGIEDMNAKVRSKKNKAVNIIARSLTSILDEIKAPRIIDYLALDVEGFELTVLENIDFDKYQFRVMTVERRATADRVIAFLKDRGYEFIKRFKDDNGFIRG